LAKKPQSRENSRPAPVRSPARAHASQSAPPVTVSGRWLAGAFLTALAFAAVCAYGALCMLFYQGQWQLVLHPSKTITTTPASQGLKFDEIHFYATETGLPQLNGWWIPAATDARWSKSTLLYLHGGSGSLSDCVDDLATLHALGINIFAFDYRGYGRSAAGHPDEKRMTEDTEAAWSYLTDTRHQDAKSIVVYGTGLGASLAAQLAAKHSPAGLILDGPSEPAIRIFQQDARARILPLWLLQTERFDPVDTLRNSKAPKLFLDRNGKASRTDQLYQAAAFPKEYFELNQNGYEATLQRFFDEILP
jgi:uncharacterized protein